MLPGMNCKRIFAIAVTALSAMTTTAQQQLPMKLWYDRHAEYFEESLPIGNGKLGALVYGGVDDNVIYLNDITMWTGKPVDHKEEAGAHKWLPEIRKALFDEDYRTADKLQLNLQGHNSEYYQPLGTLHIIDQTTGKESSYRRELDIDNAICRDEYEKNGVKYIREYFASAPDKMIAIRLHADRQGALNANIVLTSQLRYNTKGNGHDQLTMTGHVTGDENESIHFCTMLTVKSNGTTSAADSVLRISNATDAIIYIVNETSFNGANMHPVKKGAPYIERAANDAWHLKNMTYGELKKRHTDDYQRIYRRFSLSLGGSFDNKRTTEQQLKEYNGDNRYLETLYAQYGRYLLISCSRTEGVPANLQGLWTPHLKSPWRGNYTMNINLEENYWPAFVGNMAETAVPLDGFIKALADNGRHTAKNFYGISSGWCASHNSDIWAMTNPVGEHREKPEWANWNLGGAWIVNTLWERYLFTQDRDYLVKTAYPLMQSASDFCINWLIDNPKKPGELITAPSTSPENEYVNDSLYHGMTCYGGTADLAIIRDLLTNTLAAAEIVRADPRKQKLTEETITKLHPYTIGKDGDLNEWYYDWKDYDPHHRHQSHLIGLYPGNHLSADSLLRACERTLIQKGDKTTGWSTGWRINLWARLKKGDEAFRTYRKLLTYVSPDRYKGADKRHSGGTYANLFDAHPPFQIDGNFGGTAGVCEMLVQSRYQTDNKQYIIELLPALPKEWSDGSVKGICARGGVEIDMTWKDSKVTTLTLTSKTGGTATLIYNGTQTEITLDAGKRKKIM